MRKDIKLLQVDFDVVNKEYANITTNLACVLKDIQILREDMQGLIDAKALVEAQARHFNRMAKMST